MCSTGVRNNVESQGIASLYEMTFNVIFNEVVVWWIHVLLRLFCKEKLGKNEVRGNSEFGIKDFDFKIKIIFLICVICGSFLKNDPQITQIRKIKKIFLLLQKIFVPLVPPVP
jgi:hypothetical protein